ncbi:unnamed protein product [Adineta steineri]|uniref:Uncharacterized protein n=1 Tax=Adineta steineri TaxID=433720 RepID=A0A816A8M7_9BILA|nr:unnamed protein product [Adineta steineri]
MTASMNFKEGSKESMESCPHFIYDAGFNRQKVKMDIEISDTIRWFTLQNGKESFANYFGDFDLDFLPAGSSLFFVFVDLELQTKSTRTLLFSCTTDKCNNQTSLQRILNALTLEENFQPFDILFNNNSKPFTE